MKEDDSRFGGIEKPVSLIGIITIFLISTTPWAPFAIKVSRSSFALRMCGTRRRPSPNLAYWDT